MHRYANPAGRVTVRIPDQIEIDCGISPDLHLRLIQRSARDFYDYLFVHWHPVHSWPYTTTTHASAHSRCTCMCQEAWCNACAPPILSRYPLCSCTLLNPVFPDSASENQHEKNDTLFLKYPQKCGCL